MRCFRIELLTIILSASLANAVIQPVQRIEPPFWWAGMSNPELQLMVHGKGIADLTVDPGTYDGVELARLSKLENPNYLVIDLRLSPDVKPGSFVINFMNGNEAVFSYSYVLYERRAGSVRRQGFNAADVVYLITPDRFANGNPGNDTVDGLKEQPNRKSSGGRHGGDILGILNNLDYLQGMGFTAVWLNPVLENDMPNYSYHGYATTDFYRVDPRFGTNELYRELSLRAGEKGIKLIMDMIVNHCGSEHWWMKDLPTSDWINFQEEFLNNEYTITNHGKSTIQDPYVARIDSVEFNSGWFVRAMPDLNQNNGYLARYLIQNAIWWIEYADLSGVRMDTYSYADEEFMREWSCAVMAEYPNFSVVGEEWSGNPAIVARWQRGKVNPDGYTSCLPGLMDFPLQEGLIASLNARDSRDVSAWRPVYRMLANDFLYANPFNLVVFPDNHDMSRFFTQVNEDIELFKLGITYILTTRGTPQIYYGTEILMTNADSQVHGVIRSDFPGGWKGDMVNGFTGEGLTGQQKRAREFFRTMLNWRRSNGVIHRGKLKHFRPRDGVYVFFRYDATGKVMVVLSKNERDVELQLDRFAEVLQGPARGREVISGRMITLDGEMTVPALSPLVIEIE